MPVRKMLDLLRRARSKRAHAANCRSQTAEMDSGREKDMFERYAADLDRSAADLEGQAGGARPEAKS